MMQSRKHANSRSLFIVVTLDEQSMEDIEKRNEILVYSSEVVADTINPEWNELGCPIEVVEEYLNEKEFILRVWNKKEKDSTVLIEKKVIIQELEYIAPLKPIDTLNDLFNEYILESIFNVLVRIVSHFQALPFNSVLFQMTDGFFASHELCLFLRKKGVLKPLHVPEVTIEPTGPFVCDFHFTLTSMQQLYLQQSHSKQDDARMTLMKTMVEDAMATPMAINAASVQSRCLMNDIRQLREEDKLLQQYLTEGKDNGDVR
ncbi:hypothetical protein JH06_3019 [Blastocystis sp. subtype 4]|uniref:hypothetical protein n=1 Tax=Blastocystis sp. subtype 4 TaxID=944170 RepID=UPI0007121939|nr:hypothetical protein JH06_3019 [Blastocystis sp. subtype 4]KNB43270.1 hypothetical protein JH06_3019 [Blastocystis sp. subtype 4]|eukprot:XP_014526713.1 hypothetical protein JH06_3019 [Blastocystis sp. subtype 4]